jgi:flagellar motor switch protein FliM
MTGLRPLRTGLKIFQPATITRSDELKGTNGTDMATISRMATRPYQVLDPRTMGRPVHLLGKFTERLREDLAELFHARLNRRYRARFEIGAVELSATSPVATAKKWQTFGTQAGRINVALERSILLCILAYRYGTPGTSQAALRDDAPAPETATEERLAVRLARELAGVVVERIASYRKEAEPAVDAAATELTELAMTPLVGTWTVKVGITEHTQQVEGLLHFQLEESWIALLLRGLVPRRPSSNVPRGTTTASRPLPARLQLTMTARLLEKSVPLGTLLDLRTGQVLPITLGSTDVLIEDSRLFTASIAEHKGKLCLTSFEDVE